MITVGSNKRQVLIVPKLWVKPSWRCRQRVLPTPQSVHIRWLAMPNAGILRVNPLQAGHDEIFA